MTCPACTHEMKLMETRKRPEGGVYRRWKCLVGCGRSVSERTPT